MRATADVALEYATGPHKSFGNQFKQVHKWQFCVQYKHRRPGT
jgi:hypothetical protein